MTLALKSAIYGLAVGDALGVPYEFKQRDTFECKGMVGNGTHRQPAGTWSDDTSMTLATCASIKEHGRIGSDDLLRRFRHWRNCGDYTIDGVFDVGSTTATALAEGQGCPGERSNGNGSLMRILPLAFIDVTDEQISNVSAITHAHAKSTDACIVYVRFAQSLIAGLSPIEALASIDTKIPDFSRLGNINQLIRSDIRSSGYVVDTLEAALWCLVTTGSYQECVLCAVNLGDDTDTVAAVAGGLAGIVYRYNSIPQEWIKVLRGKDIIDSHLF